MGTTGSVDAVASKLFGTTGAAKAIAIKLLRSTDDAAGTIGAGNEFVGVTTLGSPATVGMESLILYSSTRGPRRSAEVNADAVLAAEDAYALRIAALPVENG